MEIKEYPKSKRFILAQLHLLENLAEQFDALKREIADELRLTQQETSSLDLIKSRSCKEAMEMLKGSSIFNASPDGEDVKLPHISLTHQGTVQALNYAVDGGTLQVYCCMSDYGTRQVGMAYLTPNRVPFDLSLAEVKRGSLAEVHGLPANNKDLDLYVWEEPCTEDFTKQIHINHAALLKCSQGL